MRVLIADHDAGRAQRIAEACLSRGHRVEQAAHGADALESALEQIPQAIVCPVDLAVIDASRLADILRGNPRTRAVSFIFLAHDEQDAPLSLDPRDASLVQPWREQDVLDDLDAIAARAAPGDLRPDSEIQGKLSQISVADLLQIFQMNLKSGSLRVDVDGPAATASILVRQGQVVDAVVPLRDGAALVGEKALYRLLRRGEGRFEFLPGEVAELGRIQRPTRVALLEGMRQRDEWERLCQQMPPLDSRVRLDGPEDPLHTPLMAEVRRAAESYRRLSAIVDHCAYTDYEVLRGLSELLTRGQLQLDAGDPGRGHGAGAGTVPFGETHLRRLREWAAMQRPRTGPVLKVLVAASDPGLLRSFVDLLRDATDFVVDERLVREPDCLGALWPVGHIPLRDGLSLRLIALPPEPVYEPLWEIAAHGLLGAIVLPDPELAPDADPVALPTARLRARGRPVLCALLGKGADADAKRDVDATFVIPGPGESGGARSLYELLEGLVP